MIWGKTHHFWSSTHIGKFHGLYHFHMLGPVRDPVTRPTHVGWGFGSSSMRSLNVWRWTLGCQVAKEKHGFLDLRRSQLPCDIAGAKEPGMMYFPTKWGAKEPQNPQNHRVANQNLHFANVIVCFLGGEFISNPYSACLLSATLSHC